MEQQQWLTLEEFARTSRLHLDTVRRYAREGRIIARKIGKRYLIKAADAEAFMEGAPQPKPAESAKPEPARRRRSGD
jgi:excisionase family DNA binding protein